MRPTTRRKALGTLLALLVALPGLGALESENNDLRLVLHEGIGRFSLYARNPAGGEAAEGDLPLFVDRDPRSSSLSLLVGDRVFRLGEGGEFRESVEQTPHGARFLWQSNQLRVTQEFALEAAGPNTVGIEVSVSNTSTATLTVGVRLCLDTYLGEGGLAHFRTDGGLEINHERTLQPAEGVRYWSSTLAPDQTGYAGSGSGGAGLLCLTSAPEATPPDRVAFANWKRLNEASWDYQTSPTRNFNLVPYSINDSAVCQYYDPQPLPPKATRRVVVVLGTPAALGPDGELIASAPEPTAPPEAAPEPEQPPAAPKEPPPAPEEPAAPPAAPTADAAQSLQQDLQLLDALLRTIQEYLSAGTPVSAEDLRLMRETLSGIKSRSAGY